MLPSLWSQARSSLFKFSLFYVFYGLCFFQGVLLAEVTLETSLPPVPIPATVSQKDTVIRKKDLLLYRVLEDRDPPIKLQVSEAGTICIPYYGELSAAGKTLAEIKSSITLALEDSFYKKATVFLSLDSEEDKLSPSLVYLGGKVNKVGTIPLDPEKKNTVAKIILAAGGFADFADDTQVKLVRKDLHTGLIQTFHVDVAAVLEKGQLDKDPEVIDGDFIIVPKRLFNW